MKQVSDLIGSELDYWVAKALGYVEAGSEEDYGYMCWRTPENVELRYVFNPSRDWSIGGRIIEHERIQLWDLGDEWIAKVGMKAGNSGCGHTVLIAAMRAYVASRYGETVPSEEREPDQ